MTTTAKRKTAPRKAAKRIPNVNGAVNGSVQPPPPEEFVPFPPPELTGPREDEPPPTPEDFVPTTKPAPAPEAAPEPPAPPHPYGDRRVYTYSPADGSEPIVFPHLTTVQPTYYFLWKLRKLNLDQVQQSFEWMDMAEVPNAIQERVAKLPDEEQATFFLGWFEPAVQPVKQGAGPPGES